jgi:hypothetical protein
LEIWSIPNRCKRWVGNTTGTLSPPGGGLPWPDRMRCGSHSGCGSGWAAPWSGWAFDWPRTHSAMRKVNIFSGTIRAPNGFSSSSHRSKADPCLGR